MAMFRKEESILNNHPCFSEEAHLRFGRIHLPVAPACNIQCKYCLRKYDCPNESRPGITSRVLSPEEALERVRSVVRRNENLTVVGIAGPGDPLANDSTFEVLRRINREFPELTLCVSTNGLLLPERLDTLLKIGVKSITITINAVLPEVAARVYSWILYKGRRYSGVEAGSWITHNQWLGLRMALEAGLIVKINTVLIPGVNEAEIPMIAWLAGRRGAHLMNIIPLIPQAEFKEYERPSRSKIENMRAVCSEHIRQMTHCRQCRADACGVLGEDKDMELEVLMSRIGEEYCDMVV